MKLLARIYRVSKGEILINGINLNDLKAQDWYKNVGILFQDFNFYYHLNVRENIYLGRPENELVEADIAQAAESADAADFINEYNEETAYI